MRVLKFGGASLRGAEDIRKIVDIIASGKGRRIVVLSALNGVTDSLHEFLVRHHLSEKDIEAFVGALRERHLTLLDGVSDGDDEASTWITSRCEQVARLIYGVLYTEELTPRTRDLILSFGERLSVAVLSSALRAAGIPSSPQEADDLGMITDGEFGHASVILEKAMPRLRAALLPLLEREVPVVTGYFGCNAEGGTTTFGRGGSDYSAAVLASALDASALEVWKDVDGFMTADPMTVPAAGLIRELSYDEAAELSYFGARILHPRTVEPLIEKGIPLRIMNTHRPGNPGSLISSRRLVREDVIKSVAHTANIAIVKIRGAGVGYKPGVLMQIVSRLSNAGINIKSVLTAQTCINILLDSEDSRESMAALKGLTSTVISGMELVDGLGLIAVVGEGLIERKGIGARVFRCVAERGVNIEMVAAGASRVAMYFLVREDAREDAVRAIHREFFENGG